MKKYNYLPILLFILSLSACSGIESKIEEKIKTSLDDPSSFELISIIPSDTLDLKQLSLSTFKWRIQRAIHNSK